MITRARIEKAKCSKGKETSRKKGKKEAKRLVCSVNYGNGAKKVRGRKYQSFSG